MWGRQSKIITRHKLFTIDAYKLIDRLKIYLNLYFVEYLFDIRLSIELSKIYMMRLNIQGREIGSRHLKTQINTQLK